MTESQLRKERERKAEEIGEGSYRNKADGLWYFVDATFYPKPQLWITKYGQRHRISKAELDRDYHQLSL